jgi:integrase
MTPAEFLAVWGDLFPRSETTLRNNVAMVRPFVRTRSGSAGFAVTPFEAQAWGRDHPAQIRFLRTFWRDAERLGLAESNPWVRVKLPRSAGRARFVPPTESEVLELAAFASVDLRAPLLVTAFSGLRLGEMAALEARDVQLVPARLRVRNGKGGKERTVGVYGPGAAVLGELPLPEVGLVFRSGRGRPWTKHSVGRAFRPLAGGLSTWHGLRHFAATWLLDRGANPIDVAVQLGHTDRFGHPDPELVVRLYGHPDPERSLERLARLTMAEVRTGGAERWQQERSLTAV